MPTLPFDGVRGAELHREPLALPKYENMALGCSAGDPPRRGKRSVWPPLAGLNETVEDHTREHKEALTDQHIS